MGTRSVITVEGIEFVKLYKHWDGYPESTLPWLESFNKDFSENRGDDPEYKIAQLVRSSARDAEKFGLDDSLYTGWGLIPYNVYNNDIEYIYHLKTDGTVTVTEN